MQVFDATTEVFTILNGGNVGIQTAAPDMDLQVNGSAGGQLKLSTQVTTIADGEDLGHIYFSGTDTRHAAAKNGCIIRGEAAATWDSDDIHDAPSELQFMTQSDGDDNTLVAKMTITKDGDVGVGISNPSIRLQVLDDVSGYAFHVTNDGNNANRYGMSMTAGADDGSGTTYYLKCEDGSGDPIGYLQQSSNTFSLEQESDIRLKKDIVDTTIEGLNTLNSIKVRDFTWRKNNGRTIGGFIANELLDVCPQVVRGEPDAMESYDAEYDEDGNVTKEAGERIKGMTISRDKLVPLLVKAIQELSAKVTALENA